MFKARYGRKVQFKDAPVVVEEAKKKIEPEEEKEAKPAIRKPNAIEMALLEKKKSE